ncbi:MAG TPA: hypothetical protein VMZ91_06125 [Candidatus Paceibacterota bacterium]|nr:hypothetical protein [Candidatus Paceibacterota bacterium]
MGVERVDYSSDEEYQQALQEERWQEEEYRMEEEAYLMEIEEEYQKEE